MTSNTAFWVWSWLIRKIVSINFTFVHSFRFQSATQFVSCQHRLLVVVASRSFHLASVHILTHNTHTHGCLFPTRRRRLSSVKVSSLHIPLTRAPLISAPLQFLSLLCHNSSLTNSNPNSHTDTERERQRCLCLHCLFLFPTTWKSNTARRRRRRRCCR